MRSQENIIVVVLCAEADGGRRALGVVPDAAGAAAMS